MTYSEFISPGRLTLASLVLLTLGVLSFVRSGHEATLATTQKTATAQVLKTYTTRTNSSGQTTSRLQCAYRFTVDDKPYSGSGCLAQNPHESATSLLLDGATGVQQFSATVYYDPNDPTTNSLTEYAARSGYDNRLGVLFVGLGIVLMVFVLLGMLRSPAVAVGAPAPETASASIPAMPEGSNPDGDHFLEDLDRSLRGEGPKG